MPQVTRRLEFDAGHRLLQHEGKCRFLHGHRYAAEITVQGPELDKLGRVVDFGVIKELVGGWIDENWDHNIILHPEDPILGAFTSLSGDSYFKNVNGREPFTMLEGKNPTAENIAFHLLMIAQVIFEEEGWDELKVIHVRLYETPNCWADCYAEES